MDKKPSIVQALLIINFAVVNILFHFGPWFYAISALAFLVFGYFQIKNKLVHILFVLLNLGSFLVLNLSNQLQMLCYAVFNLSSAFLISNLTNIAFSTSISLSAPCFLLFLLLSKIKVPFILPIIFLVLIALSYCILSFNYKPQDSENDASSFSVLKMKGPSFFILISCISIFSLTIVLRFATLKMLLALVLGSLLALLLLKYFSKALVLLISGFICLVISIIIFTTSKVTYLDFALGAFLGICINSAFSYTEFANNAIALFVKVKAPNLLSPLFLSLGFGSSLLASLFVNKALLSDSNLYLVIATSFLFVFSFVFIFVFSRTLAFEQELNSYLKEEENLVTYERLLCNTVYKPNIQKRPNLLLYSVSILIVKIACYLIFGLRIKHKQKVKRPAIILSNHSTIFDFLFVGSACFPHRVSFLASSYYFSVKACRPWLKLYGVIPKNQFATDLTSIKKLKYVVTKKNGLAYIAPEGTIYANGKLGFISPSIVKIIKNFKVPVYAVNIEGGGLGKGKWQKHMQKNKVSLSLTSLFTKDQVLNMDSNLMYEKIISALAFDDFKYQKERNIKVYGAKKAEGLENLLYLCPSCHKEFTLNTEGNRLYCTHCGLEATINDDFCFDYKGQGYFENYSLWFDYQYEQLKKEMLSNPSFTLSAFVIYKGEIPTESGESLIGEGVLTLSLKDGWTYEGTYLGQTVTQNDTLAMVPIVTITMGLCITLPFKYGHGRNYYFKEDGRVSQKWHIASRIIAECINKET